MSEYRLEVRGVTKVFPGTRALDQVQLQVRPSEVHALCGENGAGKSTILEAIGLLSAAMTDRVNDLSLQRKGMRLSAPSMYKSKI